MPDDILTALDFPTPTVPCMGDTCERSSEWLVTAKCCALGNGVTLCSAHLTRLLTVERPIEHACGLSALPVAVLKAERLAA